MSKSGALIKGTITKLMNLPTEDPYVLLNLVNAQYLKLGLERSTCRITSERYKVISAYMKGIDVLREEKNLMWKLSGERILV